MNVSVVVSNDDACGKRHLSSDYRSRFEYFHYHLFASHKNTTKSFACVNLRTAWTVIQHKLLYEYDKILLINAISIRLRLVI